MSVTDRDSIARRAFEIWEAEGRPEGREVEHWLRAEFEVIAAPAPQSAKAPAAPKKAAKAADAKAPATKTAKPSAKSTAPKKKQGDRQGLRRVVPLRRLRRDSQRSPRA